MTAREVLLEISDDLGDEEFEKFKWFLCHTVVREGFEPIQKGHLEKANRSNTVTRICQTYGDTDALIIAREVFKKIKRVDLVRKISGSIKEPTDAKRDTEQSVQPQSVQPADWMKPVRTQLIEGLSDVTVDQILDRLYDQGVINAQEMNVIREQTAANKARKLIDLVHRKGPDAVSVLKTALREVDQFLFKNLNLM